MDDDVVAGCIVMAIGGLLLLPIISLIPTFLWYCFDDALASLTGVEALGNIAWYHMWPFTFFVASLFKSTTTTASNRK